MAILRPRWLGRNPCRPTPAAMKPWPNISFKAPWGSSWRAQRRVAIGPPANNRDKAIIAVDYKWTLMDPASAGPAILAALPPGPQLNTAISQAAQNWIIQDQQAASQWIDTLPPSPGARRRGDATGDGVAPDEPPRPRSNGRRPLAVMPRARIKSTGWSTPGLGRTPPPPPPRCNRPTSRSNSRQYVE